MQFIFALALLTGALALPFVFVFAVRQIQERHIQFRITHLLIATTFVAVGLTSFLAARPPCSHLVHVSLVALSVTAFAAAITVVVNSMLLLRVSLLVFVIIWVIYYSIFTGTI